MDGDKETDNTEASQRFVLFIDKRLIGDNIALSIRSINRRMPRTDVILLVDAWLKKVRDDFNSAIQGSIGSIDER